MSHSPNTHQKRNVADPMKLHACVKLLVWFKDGQERTLYSRDVNYRKGNNPLYKNVPFATRALINWINSHASKVSSSAIFEWDGECQLRGRKLSQFDSGFGWDKNFPYY